ncbi:hypothetical protein CC85DRAFT_195778 [Cutaneotrichosporon oleaginosum]|uniref:Transmembrane protein n=1 Tax=Cutaneotrichosporon oleaginosum TaxID=879819 RepID=A0A0J0XEK2_9TREE|nr:uncharacterized protein CC85DRAFT_195778 [Cutaneotrichosporon oleaginosum]KLT39478.1 hypothetical protein CC85DRAFT_195778 [Cutaneotrichosporon oleaginosum]TXT09985.1 hypothetical protein COLE_03919 [Cutaneotrichosporon oleaginosum]
MSYTLSLADARLCERLRTKQVVGYCLFLLLFLHLFLLLHSLAPVHATAQVRTRGFVLESESSVHPTRLPFPCSQLECRGHPEAKQARRVGLGHA